MAYTLHNRLGSGGFAVEAVLTVADVAFTYEPMASTPNAPIGPALGNLNPWGQVPVLELPDGTAITEVAAILAHLSQAEPAVSKGPALWIDNPPQFLRWSVFLSVNVYEGLLRKSYAERYFTRFSDCPGETSVEHPDRMDAAMARSLRDAAGKRTHLAFECIEQATKGHRYLLSDRLSPCDIYLAMLYAWFNRRPDLPKCAWITEQVATHPIIRPIWQRNFQNFLDFKWHEL